MTTKQEGNVQTFTAALPHSDAGTLTKTTKVAERLIFMDYSSVA